MTPRARDGGFTLLEVVVALAILSLAVVTVIQGFAQGLRLLKLSGDHQLAMLLADEKAREVLTPSEGTEQGVEGPFEWERTTTLLPTPTLVLEGEVQRVELYAITVRVRWDHQRRQIELATLRTALAPPDAIVLERPVPPAMTPGR